jgi:tetratricopeptide (TPR) repeat protein
VGTSAGMLSSRERMWWQTLRLDPENAAARIAFVDPLLRAGRHEELVELTAGCPSRPPEVECGCREIGIEAELRARDAAGARAASLAIAPRCATRASFAALNAQALAIAGENSLAIAESTRGLGLPHRRGDEARLRYALAMGLERGGRYDEATAEVERALASGAGADAALLASGLAILRGDYGGATERVRAVLADDPSDPRALYNQALIADHEGRYNEARQGYLSVLAVEPNHADARWNLARLTWRAGVRDEARHHARRFAESFPNDPRSGELKRQMELEK